MLTLYYKPTCPFCRQVLAVADRLELQLDLQDVSADEEVKAELIKKGGKMQVPYLVDSEKSVEMYESDDIVTYIQKEYGGATSGATKPRVHISDSTCVACEG